MVTRIKHVITQVNWFNWPEHRRLHISHYTPCLPHKTLHNLCFLVSPGYYSCSTRNKRQCSGKLIDGVGGQTRCIMGHVQIENCMETTNENLHFDNRIWTVNDNNRWNVGLHANVISWTMLTVIFDCIRALKSLRYRSGAVTSEQLKYFNAARYSYRLFTLSEHVCDKHFAWC